MIHQIWLGDKPKPHKTFGKLWTEPHKELMEYNILHEHPANISDIMRLLIIRDHGGFYFDCDCEYYGGIERYADLPFVAGFKGHQNGRPAINNEFFGARPNHRIINLILEQCYENRFKPLPAYLRCGYPVFASVCISHVDIDMHFIRTEKLFKHHFDKSWCL